jgi:hypothetical protein
VLSIDSFELKYDRDLGGDLKVLQLQRSGSFEQSLS